MNLYFIPFLLTYITSISGVVSSQLCVITVADGSISKPSFQFPAGIVVDKLRNVYFSELFTNTIRKINHKDGSISIFAGNGIADYLDGKGVNSSFHSPIALAIDNKNNIYVADSGNYKVRKITPKGVVTTVVDLLDQVISDGNFLDEGYSTFGGIAVDSKNNIYVTDFPNKKIRKISISSKKLSIVTTFHTVSNPKTQSIGGLAIDTIKKLLYISDSDYSHIRRISLDKKGSEVEVAGNKILGDIDGPAQNASFNLPGGLVFDTKSKSIYIADYMNNKIRKISSNGTVTTLAGNGSLQHGWVDGQASISKFFGPSSVDVDSKGNLFVTDYFNHKIRKIVSCPRKSLRNLKFSR